MHMFDHWMVFTPDTPAGRGATGPDGAALQKAFLEAGPSARCHEYQQACIPEGRTAVICVYGHVH
jgi:hypothetical protein